jgi:hypothetical protein
LRNEDDVTGFPKLSAPPRRAFSHTGYTRLDQLAQVSESEWGPDLTIMSRVRAVNGGAVRSS